jgi:hypothetical protein
MPVKVRIMKIVDVGIAVVEGNFDWPFVRIETDEGIYAGMVRLETLVQNGSL